MDKKFAEERLNEIIKHSSTFYNYEISIKDWENYGKKRSYISVFEKSAHTTHSKKYDFGFIDLITGEYHEGRKNLEDNFNLAGARF